jgi:TonB family protein
MAPPLLALAFCAIWLNVQGPVVAGARATDSHSPVAPQSTPPPTPTGNGLGTGAGGGIGDAEGAAPDPAEAIYRRSDVTKQARILSKPQPGYTEQARENLASGTIRLSIVLATSGKVIKVRPLGQLPDGLTEAAIEAARRIQFDPAIKDGKPVSQYQLVEYHFNIYVDEKDPRLKSHAMILDKPEPEYTDLARQHKVHGTVILQLLLSPNGTVRVEQVLQGLSDGLTEAAAAAASKIKFTPAVSKAGNTVGQYYRVEYKFKL